MSHRLSRERAEPLNGAVPKVGEHGKDGVASVGWHLASSLDLAGGSSRARWAAQKCSLFTY